MCVTESLCQITRMQLRLGLNACRCVTLRNETGVSNGVRICA